MTRGGLISFLPRTLTLCSPSDSAETCRETKTGAVRSPGSPPRGQMRTVRARLHKRGKVTRGKGSVCVALSRKNPERESEAKRRSAEAARRRGRVTSSERGKSRRGRKSRSRRMGGRLDGEWEFLCLLSGWIFKSLPWSVSHCRRLNPCQRFLPPLPLRPSVILAVLII